MDTGFILKIASDPDLEHLFVEGWWGTKQWFEIIAETTDRPTVEFFNSPPGALPLDEVMAFLEKARSEMLRLIAERTGA